MLEMPFGEWLPDRVDYKNPGLETCTNVIPSPRGYQPAYAPASGGVVLSERSILGAEGFERADGTPVVVCATTSDLYVIVSGSSTASSLSLSLSVSDYVSFAQFDTKIYASTKNGATWVLDDIETDVTFAAATGSPPKANAMGRVQDFLVMGNLEDVDASNAPYRIRWSKYNNPDGAWDTDIATQSEAVDLDAQEGPVTAISGGSFGFVFQKNGVSRLTYTGSGSVFDLELYEKNRGCTAPGSVVRIGDVAYFLSQDGFMRTDGTSVESVSRTKVWEWFLENVNQTYLGEVVGAADWENRCVVWVFAGGDGSEKTGQMWFNWETGQWSYVASEVEYVVETQQDGLTLEQVAAIYPDIDAMQVTLDSPIFQAKGRTLGAFVLGNAGGAFSSAFSSAFAKAQNDIAEYTTITGSSLPGELVSGSIQLQSGRRNFVRGVTPLVENEDEGTQVTLHCRERMTQSIEASDTVEIGNIGFAPFNHDARYFRIGHTMPSGQRWRNAYGYQVDASPSGRT